MLGQPFFRLDESSAAVPGVDKREAGAADMAVLKEGDSRAGRGADDESADLRSLSMMG